MPHYVNCDHNPGNSATIPANSIRGAPGVEQRNLEDGRCPAAHCGNLSPRKVSWQNATPQPPAARSDRFQRTLREANLFRTRRFSCRIPPREPTGRFVDPASASGSVPYTQRCSCIETVALRTQENMLCRKEVYKVYTTGKLTKVCFAVGILLHWALSRHFRESR